MEDVSTDTNQPTPLIISEREIWDSGGVSVCMVSKYHYSSRRTVLRITRPRTGVAAMYSTYRIAAYTALQESLHETYILHM